MITDAEVERIPGAAVYGADGEKIGKAGAVYRDDQTGRPEWVTVQTGLFGTSESFVPLAQADFDGDDLRVPYDKAKVKDAPRVDDEGHLDISEEDRLFEYYGVGNAGPQGSAATDARDDRFDDRDRSVDRDGRDDRAGHGVGAGTAAAGAGAAGAGLGAAAAHRDDHRDERAAGYADDRRDDRGFVDKIKDKLDGDDDRRDGYRDDRRDGIRDDVRREDRPAGYSDDRRDGFRDDRRDDDRGHGAGTAAAAGAAGAGVGGLAAAAATHRDDRRDSYRDDRPGDSTDDRRDGFRDERRDDERRDDDRGVVDKIKDKLDGDDRRDDVRDGYRTDARHDGRTGTDTAAARDDRFADGEDIGRRDDRSSSGLGSTPLAAGAGAAAGAAGGYAAGRSSSSTSTERKPRLTQWVLVKKEDVIEVPAEEAERLAAQKDGGTSR
ncbi:PRC-barrel domain-containing protein [Quadrisphaera setariae]|uniref:PRC-barrel domain-containing protein n=1 Tax=Quadrisphaera setariae TaxID=2593304 RepID=UPI001C9BFBA5|nr:PRC-barrel domain-containing protein [Quadrisphaera setariae]